MQRLGHVLTGVNSSPLMGLAAGIGEASGYHRMPQTLGSILGAGIQGAQAQYHQALTNAMQRAVLPLKQAETRVALAKLAGHGLGGGQYGRMLVSNIMGGQAGVKTNPKTVAADTLQKTKNSWLTQGPNSRAYLLSQGWRPPAQGPLSENATQTQRGGVAQMRGAGSVMTANAVNRAGGAASATYPYQAGLSYHNRAPGVAGGTLGPRPGPFRPMSATAPGASRKAVMQREIGTMFGLNQLAQSTGQVPPAAVQPFAQSAQALPAAAQSAQAPQSNQQRNTPAVNPLAGLGAMPQASAKFKQLLGAVAPPRMGQTPVPVPGTPLPRGVAALPRTPIGPMPPAGRGIFSPGESVAGYQLQKAAAEHTLGQETEAAKATESAQAQLARLAEMQQTLNRIPVGGNLAKLYGGVANALNFFGVKMSGLTAMQEYTKYRTNFVADAARKMGSRISYQEVSYLAKGVPDFTLAGNAPRALLAQLQGAAQYDIARDQALPYYVNSVKNLYGPQFQGTARGFEQWWQRTGVTPGSFMFLSTAAALPSGQQAKYFANLRHTPAGREYFKGYLQAQTFLRQHPELVPFWR
jgi:hypothetical protein